MISDIISTNWYEVGIVACRALISLLILFLITKIIGKKQVSELSLFDYVISISIGNFAAEISMNIDVQLMNGIIAVSIFGFIAMAISILTMKSILLRRLVIGSPTILIENGKFVYKNLRRVKIDINDFLESARIAGYFDISNIKYALMEANGQISFLPKEEYVPATPKDLNLKPSKQGLCANVIIDGKVMPKNLEKIGKDEAWLEKQLKVKGYKSYEKILLATVDIDEKLCIFDKHDVNTIENVLE